jgi:hypothetical protein
MNTRETTETTLGSLIAALTQETSQFVRDKKEVYQVVAFMLAHLLNNSETASRRSRYWH